MKEEGQNPEEGYESDLCECGFSAEMHCMACGECPQDKGGTLGDFCGGLGLWTEDGEIDAPCVSERMLTCPWCGIHLMEDHCEHQVKMPPGRIHDCPVQITCSQYWMAYEPTSAAGNSSVVFLYIIEDPIVVKEIRKWSAAKG
jgi:hypothetical protein